MFRRVLVATDLSDVSGEFVAAAAHLMSVGMREAHLVHVLDAPSTEDVPERTRKVAREEMNRQAEALRKAGVKVESHLVAGLPFQQIDHMAEYLAVDLVTMCSRGRTLQEAVLLGSVPDRFMRIARFPLLLLRCSILYEGSERRCEVQCERLFEHVLFPTDFSDNAAAAFAVLKEIVPRTHPRVTLCHVQEAERIRPHLEHRLEEFDRIDSERLSKMADDLRTAGSADVQQHIVFGHPIPELMALIRKTDPTLLLLGNQGRGWVKELFVGSTAHNLARLTDVPVLLIPHRLRRGMAR